MNTREMTDKVSDQISDKFQDLQKRATEAARNVTEQTDKYVRENTWQSIGMAAVLGCVVGFLLANRGD
jgi:ElaB/YqjD/DUF883 family membrane-anchored ribosome-binding protein